MVRSSGELVTWIVLEVICLGLMVWTVVDGESIPLKLAIPAVICLVFLINAFLRRKRRD